MGAPGFSPRPSKVTITRCFLSTRPPPSLSQKSLPSSPHPFFKCVPSDLASGLIPQQQMFWVYRHPCLHLHIPSCPSSFPCTPHSQGCH